MRPFVLWIVATHFVSSVFVTSAAHGQATIAPTQNPPLPPTRFLPDGTSLGTGSRPSNLNPTGISYADCIQDQSLQFSVTLSNFGNTSDGLEVWATRNGDCSQPAARTGDTAVCWPLGVTAASLPYVSPTTAQFRVRVQDLVGPQNLTPSPVTYERFGVSACQSQPTFTSE